MFSVEYRIKNYGNYNNEAKYKAKNGSCEKIRKKLIVDLEKYNI